ncbi:MAG: zinc-binding dehydrogenase [Spirochaetales bacterium]|nr:zinc-binding dehydrogenase [Spirochaetales bacterium]
MQPKSHFVTTVPGPGVIAAIAIGNVFSRKKASTIMVKPNGADLEYLTGLANAGKLRSEIHKVFGLAEAGAAHLESEGGRARGKIVIRI